MTHLDCTGTDSGSKPLLLRRRRGPHHAMVSCPCWESSSCPSCLLAQPAGRLEGLGGTLGHLAGLRLHQNVVRVSTVHDGVVLEGAVHTCKGEGQGGGAGR